MIEEDFVSFEVAKLLREKGFNEPTLAYAYSNDMINYYSKPRITDSLSIEAGKIPMPTLQMACKWLREVHKIYIDIDIRIILEQWAGYNVTIYKTNTNNCLLGKFISLKGLKDNTSYEQAWEAAIKYCLKHLI